MQDEVTVKCEKQHTLKLSLSEFEEALEWDRCPKCGSKILEVEPDTFEVECVNCTWSEENDWQTISACLDQGCPRCGPELECDSPLHIIGSFYHKVAQYDACTNRIAATSLQRTSRADYWEVVIHFCEHKEFLSILKSGKIHACRTGLFGVPAVCFTETPLLLCEEIRRTHGDFGIAFQKSEIIRSGGNPAVYLQDSLIEAQKQMGGFCDDIKPFINILRIPSTAPKWSRKKKVDFLHEREWRVGDHVDPNTTKPLGLVFPEGKKFSGPYGSNLIEYAYKYDEIVER
ncbi:MAG: hypothetical protein OEW20_06910 [Nitrospira sp.]|nr:hypothetical protein [Nitrospira sp.]